MSDFEKIKVHKIEETKNYGNIFDVNLPVRFYFDKDGSFDGIEVYVENATERDKQLIEELCTKLGKATEIKFTYKKERNKDDNE